MAGDIIINCGAARVARLPFADGKWSQRMVTTVWLAMGYPAPAPIMPPSMEGLSMIATKTGPYFASPTGSRSTKKGARQPTRDERKFLNFWGAAVDDPCRKQSVLSKIGGGILKLASVFLPAMAAFQAVQTGVSTVQDAQRQKELVKTGTELLTAAARAQPVPMNPAPITTLPPPPAFVPMNPAPITRLTAQQSPPTTPQRRAYTANQYAIAGVVGIGLYLLFSKVRRS